MFGGVKEIARRGQLAPATIGGSVHRPDKRQRQPGHRPHHALIDTVLGEPGFVAHAVAFLQIAPGAECCLPGPGQNNDTRVARIKIEGFEHTRQLFGHPRVEGVRGLRPVQGDQADLRRRRGDGDRVEGCRIFSHLKLATAITRPDHKGSREDRPARSCRPPSPSRHRGWRRCARRRAPVRRIPRIWQ